MREPPQVVPRAPTLTVAPPSPGAGLIRERVERSPAVPALPEVGVGRHPHDAVRVRVTEEPHHPCCAKHGVGRLAAGLDRIGLPLKL